MNVTEIIEGRKLKWFGHVKGIMTEKIIRVILDWIAEGKRRSKRKEQQMNDVRRRCPEESWLKKSQKI